MEQATPDWETPTTRTWVLRSEADAFEQRAMIYVVHGAEQRLEAGQVPEVVANVPHKARNASADEVAVVRWATRPALRTERFFRTVGALGDAGVLHSALLAHEYGDVFRATGALALAIPAVARLARLFGRRLPEPVGVDVKES